MNPILLKMKLALIVIAGILAAGPALADKPAWAGKETKGGKDVRKHNHGEQQAERRDEDGKSRHDKKGSSDGNRGHFNEQHRTIVREYYVEQSRGGRCPPGLAKKRNGCMPPGQAKKWQIGRPLPREVIYYQVPQSLVVKIGPPPSGHRYVRVASDILLIAIGTGMVIDAIEDLGR